MVMSVSVPSISKATDTENAVRQLLSEFFESVERHELQRFLALFAEGEDFTVFENAEMYDWPQFVEFAEGFFKELAEIVFEVERCAVDPIGPGVAVATGIFNGKGKTVSGEPVAIRHSFTFVLVTVREQWRIKHVHESAV